jgi:hypothetical protein
MTGYPFLSMPGEEGTVAPACPVTIRGGASALRELALIDTGASQTMLTTRIVRDLALQPDVSLPIVRVYGAVSGSELACQYVVDVEMLGFVFKHVGVHLGRRDYAIIGRDILDRVVLHVDGPRQEFRIELPRGGEERENGETCSVGATMRVTVALT